MERLRLEGLSAGYRSRPVITGLSLTVGEGELFALLGPSGAGKTTILKTIAGLLPSLGGRIWINGLDVTPVAAELRDAVLIFQKPLLFPFLTAGQNVGFGLRMRGNCGPDAQRRIDAMMELTGLAGLHHRRIHELSGGQQQRVALARGLVLNPSILLMDEPLSNLDADLRQQMRRLILDIRAETGVTILFVTHDQAEAMMVSDRMALLLEGSLLQVGSPRDLFHRPASATVARFFGCDNLVAGTVRNSLFSSPLLTMVTALADGYWLAAIRPESIDLLADPAGEALPCTVESLSFEGSLSRIRVSTAEGRLTVLTRAADIRPGQTRWLRFARERVHFLPGDAPVS